MKIKKIKEIKLSWKNIWLVVIKSHHTRFLFDCSIENSFFLSLDANLNICEVQKNGPSKIF